MREITIDEMLKLPKTAYILVDIRDEGSVPVILQRHAVPVTKMELRHQNVLKPRN